MSKFKRFLVFAVFLALAFPFTVSAGDEPSFEASEDKVEIRDGDFRFEAEGDEFEIRDGDFRFESDGEEFKTEGTVTAVEGDSFMVDGTTVMFDPATVEMEGDLVVGAEVKAEGMVDDGFIFTAEEVKADEAEDVDEDEDED